MIEFTLVNKIRSVYHMLIMTNIHQTCSQSNAEILLLTRPVKNIDLYQYSFEIRIHSKCDDSSKLICNQLQISDKQ